MSSEIDSTLAVQINEALAESNRLAESAVMEAARAGKLMIEAKKQVAHGQWSQWIQDNCHMTDRNARRYMQLARELPKLEDQRRAEVMSLPIREAVQVIAQSKAITASAQGQNGHSVSVLAKKTGVEQPTFVAEPVATKITPAPSVWRQRLHRVKSFWRILIKKLGRQQTMLPSAER